MIHVAPRDVTGLEPSAAITNLVSFNEPVFTKAGQIDPTPEGFTLVVADKEPRVFATASGAVEVLFRLTKRVSKTP